MPRKVQKVERSDYALVNAVRAVLGLEPMPGTAAAHRKTITSAADLGCFTPLDARGHWTKLDED